MGQSRREFLRTAGVVGAAAVAGAPVAVKAAGIQPEGVPAVRIVQTDVLDIG